MNLVPQTIGTFREFIKNELTGLYPGREINSLTDMILNNLLNIPGHEIRLKHENAVSIGQSVKIVEIVNELKTFKPIQYILGYADFYGLRIKITPDVLIPRPETEELVKWIIDDNSSGKLSILDIGTGSGCISIALKTNMPGANVFASDISDAALEVAKKNALSLKNKITFFHQDILDHEEGKSSPCEMRSNFACKIISQGKKEKGKRKKFSENVSGLSDSIRQVYDIIVSNPPYIPEKEKKYINKNVTDWEPHEALFVPDRDQLIFYRNIAAFGLNHLRPKGKIYLEIHEKSGPDVKKLFTEFDYNDIVIRKDINGKDRMIRCRKK